MGQHLALGLLSLSKFFRGRNLESPQELSYLRFPSSCELVVRESPLEISDLIRNKANALDSKLDEALLIGAFLAGCSSTSTSNDNNSKE